ncbi:hypothetical protein GCM10009097_16520 [Pigmentiphaga daeguensis]|uniref:Uncharacterized protein n=1 Tax=Pigmentiphaga daeguensis TaxID=414049 RepID=A0ABN1BLZ6_9BURK
MSVRGSWETSCSRYGAQRRSGFDGVVGGCSVPGPEEGGDESSSLPQAVRNVATASATAKARAKIGMGMGGQSKRDATGQAREMCGGASLESPGDNGVKIGRRIRNEMRARGQRWRRKFRQSDKWRALGLIRR